LFLGLALGIFVQWNNDYYAMFNQTGGLAVRSSKPGFYVMVNLPKRREFCAKNGIAFDMDSLPINQQPYPGQPQPVLNPVNPGFNPAQQPQFNLGFNSAQQPHFNPGFNQAQQLPFNPGFNLAQQPQFNPEIMAPPCHHMHLYKGNNFHSIIGQLQFQLGTSKCNITGSMSEISFFLSHHVIFLQTLEDSLSLIAYHIIISLFQG
jgi:hypothetical protein